MASLRCLARLKLVRLSSSKQRFPLLPLELRNSLCKTEILQKFPANFVIQHRTKYDKSNKPSTTIEEDESDDEEVDEIDKKTTVKLTVQSLRADLLLKSALGLARNKIEAAFYENRIRINGKKILKKSISCKIGDQVDLIKTEQQATNPSHMIVSRLEIVSMSQKDDSIVVIARRYKSLIVDKYE